MEPFQQRKTVMTFYKFDRSKDGVLRADDLQDLGRSVAADLGLAADDSKFTALLDGYRTIWQTFFEGADTDGDGTVSLDDFVASIDALMQHPQRDETATQADMTLFTALDLDGDGKVDEAEFAAFLRGLGATDPETKAAFAALDTDGSGAISADELAGAWHGYHMATDKDAPCNLFYGSY